MLIDSHTEPKHVKQIISPTVLSSFVSKKWALFVINKTNI